MKLLLHPIFERVKSDFCSLIDYKMRGDTIEIITAIPTLTNSYVSVFISYRDNKYAVSDGGWVHNNLYESQIPEDSETIKRIFTQYKEHFKIKETKSPDNTVFYYKTTPKLELVSALVYDVGHFVSSIVNTQNIVFKEIEDQDKKLFHNRMNGYFRERFGQSKIEINQSVKISDSRKIRFNAVVHAAALEHYYIMYVTGSRGNFFIKDLTQATVNFEIVNDYAKRLEHFKKLAIINTGASGYNKEDSELYIERLSNVLGRPPVLLKTENDNFKLAEAIQV